MELINLLIGFPIVAGVAVVLIKSPKISAILVQICSAAVMLMSVLFTVRWWHGGTVTVAGALLTWGIVFADAAIAMFIIISSIKAKKYPVTVLALMQIATLLAYEFSAAGAPVEATYVIDRLALFMVLIVGVVGALICLYAVKYMRDYHSHFHDATTPASLKDRRSMFFGVLLIFMGAMFGLVLANDMLLLLVFWEVTTLASFILIGYSRTKEATNNAFLALTINVFGGLLFTAGIVLAGVHLKVGTLDGLMAVGSGNAVALVAVFLLACAGLTKAAQMPFSRWLLGAMVAPTPVSAILHSSAMVKAGVYIIIRLAPMLGLNAAGVSIMLIGALTFIAAAVMAVAQNNAKRILAYSTISNLGLIVACAGFGTTESIWAAMMLIIFHAVAKSLLFLTVGSTEHCIGSRDVERMDGLFRISPTLTMLFIIGIAGMFVAPFGMLISKWATMQAFIDYNNSFISTVILLILAFGSTVTFFYWTKWLGKLIADTTAYQPHSEPCKMSRDEKFSLYAHGVLVILLCALFPLISAYFVVPYIAGAYFAVDVPIHDSSLILLTMVILFALIILSILLYRKNSASENSVYMAGLGQGNDRYHGSMGQVLNVSLRNMYLSDIFGEDIWFVKTQVVSVVLLAAGLAAILGGML